MCLVGNGSASDLVQVLNIATVPTGTQNLLLVKVTLLVIALLSVHLTLCFKLVLLRNSSTMRPHPVAVNSFQWHIKKQSMICSYHICSCHIIKT